MFDLNSENGAIFSPNKKYRYLLWKKWDKSKPTIMFIGLNPSKINREESNATIRRCFGFAKELGFGGCYVANLFGYITEKPKILKNTKDSVEESNNEHDKILKKAATDSVKIAFVWGSHGNINGRDKEIIKMFPDAYCFGKTKSGSPKHPLYLKKESKLEKF